MRALLMLIAALGGIGLTGPGVARAQADDKASSGSECKLVVVSLRADAVVDDPIVTIASVANLMGGDLWLRQMIGSLDVAEVSRVGKSVAISRDQVALRIQLAGVDLQKFRMEGPAQAMVKLDAIELTEQEIVKAAQQAVMQRLKADPKDVEFRLLEGVHLPAVNIGPEDCIRLVVDPRATATKGKTRIDVAIFVNDQRRGVATVVMDIAVSGEVPPLEDEVVIHPRDNVKVVARVGNLRVTVTGEAQQDGKVGQMIRVRNTDSGKIVVGRVLDRSIVEVEY
jgi:Chaperone for flagella basal body P-ring formation